VLQSFTGSEASTFHNKKQQGKGCKLIYNLFTTYLPNTVSWKVVHNVADVAMFSAVSIVQILHYIYSDFQRETVFQNSTLCPHYVIGSNFVRPYWIFEIFSLLEKV